MELRETDKFAALFAMVDRAAEERRWISYCFTKKILPLKLLHKCLHSYQPTETMLLLLLLSLLLLLLPLLLLLFCYLLLLNCS